MADLTDITSAGSTKIIGSDLTATETFPVNSTSAGELKVNDASAIAVLNLIQTNTASALNDTLVTGTIATATDTVSVSSQGGYTTSISITGTWVATLIVEGQLANNNWIAVPFYLVNNTLPYNSTFSTTTNGTWLQTNGGYINIRVRATSYTSGTISIALDSSLAQQTIFAAQLGTWSTRLQDGNGNNINSINSQLQTRDVINTSSQYQAVSVTTTAIEAKGATTRLVNRKVLSITPTNGIVYWGTTTAVTTTIGTPIYPLQTLILSFTDNIPVYLIATTTTDVRVVEGS